MDYLLRDSLFTGVEYGQYDLDWVAAHLCLGKEPLSKDDGEQNEPVLRLCLDEEAWPLCRRAADYSPLSHDHAGVLPRTTRMWEALLLCLLKKAAAVSVEAGDLLNDRLPGTPLVLLEFLKTSGAISDRDFLRLDDGTLTTAMEGWRKSGGSVYRGAVRCFPRAQKKTS